MPKPFFEKFRLLPALEKEILGSNSSRLSLLDLGCGKESLLKHFSNKINYSVGVDNYAPYIEESRRKGIHKNYVQGDVLQVLKSLDDKSFSIVVALDLVEHLPKNLGWELIRQMERVAKHKIIIYTPNGFVPQNEFDGNIQQTHLSGWEAGELRRRGFRIYGMSGLKQLRREKGEIKFKPYFLFRPLASATQLLAYFFPESAFQLFCIKELDSYEDNPN